MALYRLPFEPEFKMTWTCSGNWDVGGAHGPGEPDDHADGQATPSTSATRPAASSSRPGPAW